MPAARKSAALKVIQGTNQPCRQAPEAPSVEIPVVETIPEPPTWLPAGAARDEWARLVKILHANKLLTEGGLSAFAVLCAVHGQIVLEYSAGKNPTAHTIAQYRALVNDFGLTPGAQGRVKVPSKDEPANRFARFGKRPG